MDLCFSRHSYWLNGVQCSIETPFSNLFVLRPTHVRLWGYKVHPHERSW